MQDRHERRAKKNRGYSFVSNLGDEGAPELAPLQEESMRSAHTNEPMEQPAFSP